MYNLKIHEIIKGLPVHCARIEAKCLNKMHTGDIADNSVLINMVGLRLTYYLFIHTLYPCIIWDIIWNNKSLTINCYSGIKGKKAISHLFKKSR